MDITISINRQDVFGIVEGISATIAQHNGGEPSFDQLWASDAESPKLDIWWREGVTDLEAALMKWAKATTGEFTLSSAGSDLSLDLTLNDGWDSTKLTGLLSNKVQQFMIHAVVAGWLADFNNIVAPDYKAMAASDITSILNILIYRKLDFDTEERTVDTDKDPDLSGLSAEFRTEDIDKNNGDGSTLTPTQRTTDTAKGSGDGSTLTPTQRTTDTAKGSGKQFVSPSETRDRDDVLKPFRYYDPDVVYFG